MHAEILVIQIFGPDWLKARYLNSTVKNNIMTKTMTIISHKKVQKIMLCV